MTFDELRPHVEFVDTERLPHGQPPRGSWSAIGHFGNFELYARFHQFAPGYQCATTYRALKQPALNRLMQDLRERSGCLYFERRTDGPLLRAAMTRPGIILGLLADQSTSGLRGPFLGHDCSTRSRRPFLRCVTIANCTPPSASASGWPNGGSNSAKKFPRTKTAGRVRSGDIMRDVNRAFEAAVRRDPANWFWVHRRWKD